MDFSFDDFVKYLKPLSVEDKINEITNYFLKYVEYNYEKLEAIKLLSLNKLWDSYDLIFDRSNPIAVDYALLNLRQSNIISHNYFSKLIKYYGTKEEVETYPKGTILKFGTSQTLPKKIKSINFVGLYNAIVKVEQNEYPEILQNEMIIKGVCADFSCWIKKLADKINLNCEIVSGTTPLNHAWNMINGKHYDITYAIFTRDGFKNYNELYSPTDWLNISEIQLLKLQPERTIDKPKTKE